LIENIERHIEESREKIQKQNINETSSYDLQEMLKTSRLLV
jgi:hypothetical protein